MKEIRPVRTKKEIRDFVRFPLHLYRGNPYFVPSFYGDELALFKEDYLYRDQAEYESWLVYEGKEVLGRVTAILQLSSNEKWRQKRVRFSRFDCVDSLEVAKMLLDQVEAWAKEKGMEEVVGPLGFSDMEREGLLVEGFDYLCTYEEQYNYAYYENLIRSCGYEKEVDWVERRLFPPKQRDERIKRIASAVMERHRFRFAAAKNTKEFLKKYAAAFFDLCERTYAPLYMTVPFSPRIKRSLVKSFALIIDMRFVSMVLDENGKPVCFGLIFPSIGEALQKSGGRMTLPTIFRLLRAIKRPKRIDFALIGVDPSYANLGVPAILFDKVQDYLDSGEIEYIETNLNLETNQAIINLWKNFDSIQHKRRRSFVKPLSCEQRREG